MALFIIAVVAPAIATFIILPINKVMTVKELLKATFAVKQPVSMYLLVIGFVVIYFGIAVLTGIFEYDYPIHLSLVTFPFMILAGGLEEVGWRFVLTPTLERKMPFALACFITGVIWSIWHLPAFFIQDSPQIGMNFFIFSIVSIGISFAYSAIYRISKSIWLCVFIHALNNALYGSFIMKADVFNTAVIPATIIAIVLIIASLTAVAIAEKYRKP
jgi:membrane protease YdiL (CAAX protease family)